MIVVSVFNPEALPDYDGRTEAYEAWQANPFEGIEVLGIVDTELEAEHLIDQHRRPGRKFHIENAERVVDYMAQGRTVDRVVE